MFRKSRAAACVAAISLACGAAQAADIQVFASFRPFAGVSELIHTGQPNDVIVLSADRTALQFWQLAQGSVLTYSSSNFFGLGRSSTRLYDGWVSGSGWLVDSQALAPSPTKQVKVAPGSIIGVLDDDRFVLRSGGSDPQLTVWSMTAGGPIGPGIAASGGAAHLVADAANGLIFLDHDDSSKVEVFHLDGGGLTQLADLPVLSGEQHDVVLSIGHPFLYYGTQQFDLSDLTAPLRTFAEPILASTWQAAYSSHAAFDPVSGERLGSLPGEFSVFATAPYARDVWAYDAAANRVMQMAVIPEPSTWMLFAAGLAVWAGVRRRKAQVG